MSKTASKSLIGAFVAGALALLVCAILIFGSGRFFQDTEHFVLFFDRSINGLSAGSPVMFRGVPVGRVQSIQLSGNLETMKFQTPVFIELDYEKIIAPLAIFNPEKSTETYLNLLVAHGLRASLATQSLLTGQLMVELNFYTDAQLPEKITKVSSFEGDLIIPTIPSTFDSILEKATSLPVDQIAVNVLDITEYIRSELKRLDLATSSAQINARLAELKILMDNFNKTMVDVQKLVQTYTAAAGHVEQRVSGTLENASAFLQSSTALTDEAKKTVNAANGLLNQNSPTLVELNQAIREITESARAVRVLANMLQRNPEALLRGK